MTAKKWLLISGVVVVGLVVLYFMLKAIGVLQSAAQKVEKRIQLLKERPNWGEKDGFTREEWVRRQAIKQLLDEGEISLIHLTDETRIKILETADKIRNIDTDWLQHVESQVEDGHFRTITEGITANAVYWSAENKQLPFEVKQ